MRAGPWRRGWRDGGTARRGTARRGTARRGTARRGRTAVDPRHLLLALGILWIVDGALQLQPAMFTRWFVTGVLVPSAAGSPHFVAGPIVSTAHLLEAHVALWNALFASIQLLIGAGMLVRRTVRPALALSIVWSLAVWWLGEGLGGLFTGSASPLTGAPGSVLLYALAALVLWPPRDAPSPAGSAAWPPRDAPSPARFAAGGLLGDRGARLAWAMLWLGSAALLCQPANLVPGALRTTLTGAAAGEPGWLSRIVSQLARAVRPDSTAVVIALAVVMAAVGAGVALRWGEPALLALAIVLAMGIWMFGEAFGGVLTGSGTDPNTGPLLVLLALALYPARADKTVGEVVPAVSGVGA